MGLKNYYAQFMTLALAAMVEGFGFGYGVVRKTRVADIKPKSREDRENDYRNLIKDRKAIPRTNFDKSPSQIRFAQKNYEIRMAKKSIKVGRGV
jgi:hypothetical protein